MRLRRWVSWVAVAGMLLHAITLARHNVILHQALPYELETLLALEAGVICHVDSEADEDGKAQKLPGKDQGRVSKPCPVCLGVASAHALPASEAPALRFPQTVVTLAFVSRHPQLLPAAAVRFPSNRGPPSIA